MFYIMQDSSENVAYEVDVEKKTAIEKGFTPSQSKAKDKMVAVKHNSQLTRPVYISWLALLGGSILGLDFEE